MRHPFDGINDSASKTPASTTPTRRSALSRMAAAAFGIVAGQAVARAQGETTKALGEEGGGKLTRAKNEGGIIATTLAIGEEGAVTGALNEQGGGVPRPAPNSADLTDKQMEDLWAQLGDSDVMKANLASNSLYTGKKVVPFLKDKLKADAAVDDKNIAPLLKQLDADQFADREAGSAAIVKLGPTALPRLRAAIAAAGSPEVKRRLEMATLKIQTSPEFLRGQRGVQILADLRADKNARAIVEGLSKQAPETWLNELARAALTPRGVRLPVPQPQPLPVPIVPPAPEK